jgi:predicted SnoaL-like aldol condensation-catalyzing enzyme
VLGEGNFVIAISEAFRAGELFAVYDLFRIRNENVKDHWQISQKVPSENLANNNTMFGFR